MTNEPSRTHWTGNFKPEHGTIFATGGTSAGGSYTGRRSRSVYDALLLPALNYAERDRLERRLSLDEEAAVIEATRELLAVTAESIRGLQPEPPTSPQESYLPEREPLRRARLRANGVADELALEMLVHIVDDLAIVLETTGARLQASELVALVKAQGVSVVRLADRLLEGRAKRQRPSPQGAVASRQ